MITQRIMERKKHGRQKGVFVAILNENKQIRFGFSLCCKEDVFSKDIALKIALSRAKSEKSLSIPMSIRAEFLVFYDRAGRYFKGVDLPELV